MNYHSAPDCPRRIVRMWRRAASLLPLLAFTVTALHAADTGRIAGFVSSAQTRNALQGATVTIPRLNRTVLTDEAGRFLISDVPAGVTDLVVDYAGFSQERAQVNVGAGAAAQIDLQLRSSDVV